MFIKSNYALYIKLSVFKKDLKINSIFSDKLFLKHCERFKRNKLYYDSNDAD